MIRKRTSQEPLYYTAIELSPPSPNTVYTRLNTVVGNWQELAHPLEAAFSARTGRPTDPVVYLKIFLIGYLENLTYDTQLAERISDSLSMRRFLGYTLTENTPDHSSISRVRQRMAKYDLTGVLDTIVVKCIDAGLVSGEVVAVDGSLIHANASRDSFKPRVPARSVAEHVAAAAEANQLPEEAKPAGKLSSRVSSTTDPDARLRRKKNERAIPSYLLTHVTDGKGQIILAATVALADIGEVEAALPALDQAQAVLASQGETIGTVLADTGYDDNDFHAAIEALPAVPLTGIKKDGSGKPPGFRKEDFTYDHEHDQYICPQGQRLKYKCYDQIMQRRRYVSDAALCKVCPHRFLCMSGKGACRWIGRFIHDESREAVIRRLETPEGRALMKRRKTIVEAPFGHHKTYGGLGRLNCRGLGAARIKCLFAAVTWNLIRLIRHTAENATAFQLFLFLRVSGRALYALYAYLCRSGCTIVLNATQQQN
jgi:transposase